MSTGLTTQIEIDARGVAWVAGANTKVKEIVPVDLPRPRDQIATKELPEFVHLRAHVARLIKREQEPVPV